MKTKRVYHRKKGIEEPRDGKSFMGIFIEDFMEFFKTGMP